MSLPQKSISDSKYRKAGTHRWRNVQEPKHVRTSGKVVYRLSFEKYTGSRGKSGSSDACPEFIAKLRKTLDDAGVKYQMNEMSKVDVGGGGTIAKFAAYYGMDVIDCGVCVLSMHSPWEITAVKDIESAYSAYKAFFAD